MLPATAPLIGFSGEIIWPMGPISLPVKIGDAEHSTSIWMNFVVVISPSPYNGIIGRPGVEEKEPSTGKKQGNTRRSGKTCGSRHHKGSSLPQLVIKLGNGKKHDDS
ncbi:hypothetical protein Tco_1243437 [Tanacetum coccineum]